MFDALISRRCYKEVHSMQEAFRIIEEGSGTQFEPAIVKAFLSEEEAIEAVLERMER